MPDQKLTAEERARIDELLRPPPDAEQIADTLRWFNAFTDALTPAVAPQERPTTAALLTVAFELSCQTSALDSLLELIEQHNDEERERG